MYTLNTGSLVFIPANTLHKLNFNGNCSPEMCYIEFVKEYLSDITSNSADFFYNARGKIYNIPTELQEEFLSFSKILQEEFLSEKMFKKEMIKSLFQSFIIRFMRYTLDGKLRSTSNLAPSPDVSIQHAMQYIINHFTEEIPLDELATVAHLSPAYLSQKFKIVTGIGYKEYINILRIQKAKKLLVQTDLSINKIAFDCGYTSANYFGDIFKKIANVSPSNYRKKRETFADSNLN